MTSNSITNIPFAELQYGFQYGAAKITRLFSNAQKGWVTIGIETPKVSLQIYVTKSGKIRIHDQDGEWPKLTQDRSKQCYQAHPLRIQRKRTKGWSMPEGAVYVGRPSKWGNPLSVNLDVGRALDDVMRCFRAYAEQAIADYRLNCDLQYHGLNIEELRGKQLACWCPLDKPCHADILAELANRE